VCGGCEEFIIVNSCTLAITSYNQSCFETGNGAIRVLLDNEYPFHWQNMFACWWGYQSPSVVDNMGIKFSHCCFIPLLGLWSLQCFLDGDRLRYYRQATGWLMFPRISWLLRKIMTLPLNSCRGLLESVGDCWEVVEVVEISLVLVASPVVV